MKPRLRLFYTAMVCSFVPLITRKAYETKINHHFYLFYGPCLFLGALNGSLICMLTLTWSLKNGGLALIMGSSLIGMSHGAIYCFYLRHQIKSKYKKIVNNEYVDNEGYKL